MNGTLNRQQAEVRQRARKFAAEVLAPRARQLDLEGRFPRASLAEAAARRLTAINVPEALGGLEAGAVAYSLAVVELARACAATTVALCVTNMVAEVVSALGTREQRDAYVPKLCNGESIVGAFALSEAGAGSDPGGLRTQAVRTLSGWRINGSKLWITSGTDAGLFVVWARTSAAPGARGISAFLVPGGTRGVSRGAPERKLGLRGSTTTALDFSDVDVGPDALLGEVDQGFRAAMMALDGGRIGIASQALGVGLAALELAVAHARTGWEAGLAHHATALEAARALVLKAAWRKDRGEPCTREASMAKVFASEAAVAACTWVLEMMGEVGNEESCAAERLFRDVRVTMIYEGTSEVQRIVIGRELARRFAAPSDAQRGR